MGYQRVYKVHPNATPSKQSIKNWHIPNSRKIEMLDTKKGAGQPRTNSADILRVQNRFQQSPTVSLRRGNIELNLLPSTPCPCTPQSTSIKPSLAGG
jgi:hypothetical protein